MVPVLEKTTHLTFRHQILLEASYNLMLTSQRQEVHCAIADLFDSSTVETELAVHASHHMRAGHTDRACSLLCAAAVAAIKIDEMKEAVNMLTEALANDENKVNQAYYLGLMAWESVRKTQNDVGGSMALNGLLLLVEATGDSSLIPRIVTQTELDESHFEWNELQDMPPEDETDVSILEKATSLCMISVAKCIYSPSYGHKVPERLEREFGFKDIAMPGR